MPADEPIYLDVRPLLDKHLTGIGRFAARLVEALAQKTAVRLFHPETGQELTVSGPGEADVGIEEWIRPMLRGRRRPLDVDLAARCAAVYPAPPRGGRRFRKELGLLYDFTPLLLPGAHALETRRHFGHYFATTARQCDKLVAISHSTRADAGWLCAVPPEDVVVAYPGPSLCVRRHAGPPGVGRRDDVILVVSALEPRKNGPFLLDWFLQTRVLPPGTELWWAGPRGWWASKEFLNNLTRRQRSAGRRVRFLGKVSDGRLCELYRQAAFTIYPSLYEGFGFPVLDSLLHGAPVLCSLNSSLQEFAGPGVFYFDPCDSTSVDRACQELLAARPLAIDLEPLRQRFSWEVIGQTVMGLCA